MENIESFLEEKPRGFLTVGIGASAGGIQALKEFFQQVPADSGLAYVVILHLSPDHDSQLAQVLQVVTAIPVEQVRNKVKIEPDHVYVVPPNQHLVMQDDSIMPLLNLNIEDRRAPVDTFFRHLADSHGPRAVCVVLSGTGANGSMGLKRVKELGGVAFVQNPREAEFNEMPRNSIATELVDEVLPVAEIPAAIIAYRNNIGTVQIPVEADKRVEEDQQALREIFSQLRFRTGHDFANYKRATLLRRIERRINIHNLTNLPAYASFLQDSPDEATALLKDLLISVTNFFRDKKAFQSIEQDVVPALLQEAKSEEQLRIWVAGCATGEEAYSLAMLFAEQGFNQPDAPNVQIFATDIDETAIAVAREGYYTLNDAADVSPDRLRSFFTKEGDGYRVRREIREMILFANHNFLKDPPFSRLHLITCRNVLIYLNHTAQERVMETFHFSLKPKGFLFLGTSESVDGASDLYAIYNRENHIFQAKGVANRNYPVPESLPKLLLPPTGHQPPDEKVNASYTRGSFGELHQKLLEEYAPPSVVVNEEYEIVHMSEKVGRYFEFTAGEPTQNLLKLVRPEIRLELRTGLYRALQKQTAVEARSVKVTIDQRAESINIQIRPVLTPPRNTTGFILVIFEPNDDPNQVKPVMRSSDEPMAKHLEEELTRLKTHLRNSNEEHEYQAEELKAANEELQAMNEELRAAAEELETSKEELQSINEELRTVNQELKIKIEEISTTSNNLQNLINSADMGTIFLDRSLRTRLFTPAVREIFNLIPSDYGRPISDITNKLDYPNLLQDAETVLEKLTVAEREVRTTDNRYFMMHLSPYRTDEDRINGVVITFFDITRRKQTEQALRQSEERLRLLIESAQDYAIFSLDPDRRIISWSNGAAATVGYSEHEMLGQMGDIIFTPEDRNKNAPQTEAQTAAEEGRAQNERWHVRKDGSRFWASGSVSPLRDGDGTLLGFVKIMRDLTESKEAEERYRIRMEQEVIERTSELKASREQYASLIENTPDIITRWNKDLTLIFANSAFQGTTGVPNEKVFGKTDIDARQPMEISGSFMNSLRRAIETGTPIEHLNSFPTPDGVAHFYTRMVPEKNEHGEVETVLAIARDITQIKNSEQQLVHLKEELAQRATDKYLTLFNSIDQGFCIVEMLFDEKNEAIDYRILEANPALQKQTGLKDVVGKFMRELAPDHETYWYHIYGDIAITGEPKRFEQLAGHIAGGVWYDVYAFRYGKPEERQVAVLFNNITERKKAEEALLDSEERFRSLAVAITDSVYKMSADWKLMFNLEGKQFLADMASASSSWMENYIPSHERPVISKAIEEAVKNKGIFELEHQVIDAEGNLAWAYSRSVPKLNKDGEIIEWIGAASNITHRKKAEEALRISEKRIRTLSDAVPQVIWSNDAQGKANYFNERWYEYSGLSFEESFGLGWEAIVHPDDAPASKEKWKHALAEGKIFDTEYRLRNAEGQYCWFIGRNVPLRDDSGEIIGWFGSATDINNLKKAEEAVRNTADRLELALEAGRLGTYEYDFQTEIYICTAQHKANFGFAEDEVVSLDNFKERIMPGDRMYMETSFDIALKKDGVYATEYRTHFPNGDVRWIRSVGRFVYDKNGQAQKIVGITLDITEEKMFTEELSKMVKERTVELQRSNNDLRQFAHVASHDLKEPVRKIKIFNNRIKDDFGEVLPEKVQTYLNKINHATDRMFSMIDGVLNYSKFGKAERSFTPVDLNNILRNIELDLEVLISKKNSRLTIANLPVITANETLMYQLFYNLVLNSLKFSKADEPVLIDITSEFVQQDAKDFVKITISDNGIGFEQEYADTIFETFTRLNPADEYEGTGLGLALCKKIVERHEGFISAAGLPGKGATFTIFLVRY